MAATPKEINFAKPEKFDGNRDKFQEWWSSVALYLKGNASVYTSDDAKNVFVLSYLEGEAAAWRQVEFEKYLEDTDTLTWNDCKIKLKARFENKHGKIMAIEELQKIKVGKKWSTIAEMDAEFRRLISIAGLTDTDIFAIQAYKAAIPTAVLEPITGYATQPANLGDWYKAAEAIEQNRMTIRGTVLPNTTQRTQNTPPRPRDPDAMDVDRRGTRLTPQERDKRRAKGECFHCGKEGHYARQCPSRPAARYGQQRRWGGYQNQGRGNYNSPQRSRQTELEERQEGTSNLEGGVAGHTGGNPQVTGSSREETTNRENANNRQFAGSYPQVGQASQSPATLESSIARLQYDAGKTTQDQGRRVENGESGIDRVKDVLDRMTGSERSEFFDNYVTDLAARQSFQ